MNAGHYEAAANRGSRVAPLVEVRHVSRSFGDVHALSDVSLHVDFGEIVGLIGENGAGKSTLLNIACGVDHGYTGDVALNGDVKQFSGYHDANRHGIFRIFQELALVPNIAVYENLFLSHESHFSRAGVVQRRKMKAAARDVLARFGHGWIDPSERVGRYDFSTRQIIEIIKAFALSDLLEIDRPVLLFDEPTAGLSRDEVAFFAETVNEIRTRAGIMFVSHRLSELLELSDRVYVLKDGKVVAEPDTATCTERDLHFLMVGRQRDSSVYEEALQRTPSDEVVLEIGALTLDRSFRDVSVALRAGEITGLAGVIASGKSELARAIFGYGPRPEGRIAVNGVEVKSRSIRGMILRGVGYVSPDRGTEGVIGASSVSWNMSLASIAAAERILIDLPAERAQSEVSIQQFGIRTPSIKTPIGRLSGGNQQKAILARWFIAGVRTLILDNPTKGIDVGAKQEIYGILREFVKEGGAILLISDELVELIGLSNRVVAMKDGCVVAEIAAMPGSKPAESDVLRHMV